MMKSLTAVDSSHRPAEKIYGSGQEVPQTGLYRVVHYQHRLPHNAVMVAGEAFPPCNKCGARVVFSISETANSLSTDEDFTLEAA